MQFVAVVLVILGLGLIGLTVTRASLRRRRLQAFFASEAVPLDADVVVEAVSQLPINRWSAVYVVGSVVLSAAVLVLTGSVILGALFFVLALGVPVGVRARNRRRSQLLLRSQFVDALTSIASSMMAGSSFVRGLHELADESRPPLAPYIDQVLTEIDVGVPPSDAFRSMSVRSGLAPAAWLAHLLRVQETTGSPLATMLQRLADHVKQGDGLQREIRALTAEGRMSAYVIAALPVVLVMLLEVTDPHYLDPFATGWGITFSLLMVASVCVGLAIVNRMVHSVEA